MRRRSTLDDPHAIVEHEPGFVGALHRRSRARSRPTSSGRSPATARPLAQGTIAGVPGQVWLPDDERGALVAQTAYAAELEARSPVSAARSSPSSRSPGTSRARRYDVVIIGGGGHGLATAYYLATRHGITNVAVLEADYIASGNTGRNTTIIRANYAIPEAIRFYKHSLELYAGPRGRDRRRHPFHQAKGHRLDRPHRDGACGPSEAAS